MFWVFNNLDVDCSTLFEIGSFVLCFVHKCREFWLISFQGFYLFLPSFCKSIGISDSSTIKADFTWVWGIETQIFKKLTLVFFFFFFTLYIIWKSICKISTCKSFSDFEMTYTFGLLLDPLFHSHPTIFVFLSCFLWFCWSQ